MSDQQNNKNQRFAQGAQSGGEQFTKKIAGSISGIQNSAGGGKPFVNKLQDPKKKSN